MNTILRAIAPAAGLAMLAGTAAAQYPDLPPAPSCAAVAATNSTFWEGRFSGTYEDFFDKRWPISARGCFESEYACRRWVNEIQTIAVSPGLMTCRLVSRR